MEKIEIQVRKNKKGDLIEGDFYIRELDYDQLIELQNSASDSKGNDRLIQFCLVDSDGNEVFSKQQINLIKSRMKGTHYMACLMEANRINEFDKIAEIAEKYSKN